METKVELIQEGFWRLDRFVTDFRPQKSRRVSCCSINQRMCRHEDARSFHPGLDRPIGHLPLEHPIGKVLMRSFEDLKPCTGKTTVGGSSARPRIGWQRCECGGRPPHVKDHVPDARAFISRLAARSEVPTHEHFDTILTCTCLPLGSAQPH
jgi:hypothetical protein